LLFLVFCLSACNGPFTLASGGALEGPTVPIPESWAFTDDVGTIQLETQPTVPYSVNIWVVALGEHLYVHSGANRATWIQHMEVDPRVRMRIDGSLYELTAERVESQAEFDAFSAAYEEKYGNAPRNPSVVEAHLYRLGAR
jgi:hypothetical protein